MELNTGPRRSQQDDDCQFPVYEVLLMAEILIRRDQELVAVFLRAVEQLPVAQARPASFEGRVNLVPPQVPAEGCRRTLVEQDPQAADTCRSRRSWSRTLSACQRSTPGNQSRNCSTVAPSLRFSNSAATGTRVPRNTHAPLTLSGSRSMAGHVFQLAIRCPRSQREPHSSACRRDRRLPSALSFSHSRQSRSLAK